MSKRVLITLLHNTRNSGLAAYARIYSHCSSSFSEFYLREILSISSQWALLFFFRFYIRKIDNILLEKVRGVDLVHICDNPVYSIFILERLESWGIETIYTLHDIIPHDERSLKRRLKSFLISLITRITLHKIKHMKHVKLHLHRGCRALDSLNPKIHPHPLYHQFKFIAKEHKINEYSIGFFGRLDYYKGIDIFVDILMHLEQYDFGFKLNVYIVGSGQFKIINNFKRLNVIILNEYLLDERFDSYLANVDLIIMPYRSYTQSGILMKAISYDIPVIAHRKPEIEDFIISDYNGVLLSKLDVDIWCSEILKILNSSTKRRELSMNNNLFKQKWSPNEIASYLYN